MAFTFASMFSGGGGWDVGLAMLGGRGLWSIELNADAAQVYERNLGRRWPGHRTIVASVLDVDPATLPRPDLLVVSPPCQSYSKRRAKHQLPPRCDADVGLRVIDFARVLRPDVMLLENVTGYRTSETYRAIVAAMRDLGYATDTHIVNGMNYGMPARRHRMIGRFALAAPLPPLPPKQPRRGWYEAVRDLAPHLAPSVLAPWQRVRLERQLARRTLRFPLLVSGYNGNQRIWEAGDVVNVATPEDEPSPAIMASWKGMSGTRLYDRDGDTRVINPRVMARLQTFPDSYELPADKELASRIVGNAVPPVLAAAMAAPFVTQHHNSLHGRR